MTKHVKRRIIAMVPNTKIALDFPLPQFLPQKGSTGLNFRPDWFVLRRNATNRVGNPAIDFSQHHHQVESHGSPMKIRMPTMSDAADLQQSLR